MSPRTFRIFLVVLSAAVLLSVALILAIDGDDQPAGRQPPTESEVVYPGYTG